MFELFVTSGGFSNVHKGHPTLGNEERIRVVLSINAGGRDLRFCVASLTKIDKGDAIIESSSSKFHNVLEENSMSYDKSTEHLPAGVNVTLHFYLQSWKYFKDVEPALRRDLTFKKETLLKAQIYLDSVTPSDWTTNTNLEKNFVRVVIHIRRTDLVGVEPQSKGWALPRPGYFEDAMNFFKSYSSKVLFVVMSDDHEYSRRTIMGPNVHFVPSDENFPEIDLAIASLCDHAIITFGTFGFWAAWFANGITITQQNFPTANSTLTQRLYREDYFKPDWIDM